MSINCKNKSRVAINPQMPVNQANIDGSRKLEMYFWWHGTSRAQVIPESAISLNLNFCITEKILR